MTSEERAAALEAIASEVRACTGCRLAEGRTNAEIAGSLGLSIFTVKNHVSSILMKLAVRTRTEVASVILRSRQ